MNHPQPIPPIGQNQAATPSGPTPEIDNQPLSIAQLSAINAAIDVIDATSKDDLSRQSTGAVSPNDMISHLDQLANLSEAPRQIDSPSLYGPPPSYQDSQAHYVSSSNLDSPLSPQVHGLMSFHDELAATLRDESDLNLAIFSAYPLNGPHELPSYEQAIQDINGTERTIGKLLNTIAETRHRISPSKDRSTVGTAAATNKVMAKAPVNLSQADVESYLQKVLFYIDMMFAVLFMMILIRYIERTHAKRQKRTEEIAQSNRNEASKRILERIQKPFKPEKNASLSATRLSESDQKRLAQLDQLKDYLKQVSGYLKSASDSLRVLIKHRKKVNSVHANSTSIYNTIRTIMQRILPPDLMAGFFDESTFVTQLMIENELFETITDTDVLGRMFGDQGDTPTPVLVKEVEKTAGTLHQEISELKSLLQDSKSSLLDPSGLEAIKQHRPKSKNPTLVSAIEDELKSHLRTIADISQDIDLYMAGITELAPSLRSKQGFYASFYKTLSDLSKPPTV